MLRNVILAVGAAMVLAGVTGLIAHIYGPALVALVWGAMMVFAILFERYGPRTILAAAPTGKGWIRSDERFVDKKSGRLVTVYFKLMSGERAYVAEKLVVAAKSE